jgi:hypothetical protein
MADLPAVTLYGKADCHLCDEAEKSLAGLAGTYGLTYHKVDIQSSPALFARFRYRIPVIEVEGGTTLDWPVSREQMWAAVVAASGS